MEVSMKKIMFLLILVVTLTLSACGEASPNQISSVNAELQSVTDSDHFRALVSPYVSNYASEGSSFFRALFSTSSMSDDVAFESAVPEMDNADSESENDVSTTNVQIEGVDESDIIKTDGNRIYRVSGNILTVVELLANGEMEVILNTSMDTENENGSYTYYSGLYLTSDYLVVIGQRYQMTTQFQDEALRILPIFSYGVPFTNITLYNLDDLSLHTTYDVSGSLNTTRLIEDDLYIISSYSIYSLDEDFDPRPVTKTNGEESVIPYESIHYIDDIPKQSFTLLTKLTLDENPELDPEVLLGAFNWGQVYVNLEGIYLAYSEYNYQAFEETDDSSMVEESIYEGTLISYMFDEEGNITFGGTGAYQGVIQNQFWMDGYDGAFRIVTSEGWGESAKNRLYIFERVFTEDGVTLETIALIDEGLGKPGETIRSARFNENLVTVVTFEQTDPLYTIDLTDPSNPIIRAGLEITGFATYQHPWKNDTLIGIGYETDLEGRVIGLKFTLFDISNWDDPVVIGEPLVLLNNNSGWQYSEALHNHKAILIAESKDFIGFAINRSGYTEDGYYNTQEYLIFSIDETREMPIEIDLAINHLELADEYQLNSEIPDFEYEMDDYYYYLQAYMERAVYVNDTLYVISNVGITSHDLENEFIQLGHIIYQD